MADYLSRERVAQLSGGEGSGVEELGNYLQSYYGLVIRPRLLAAGSSCANGKLAIQTFLGYERLRRLLGFAEDDGPGVMQELVEVMQRLYNECREEAIAECQAKVDPGVLIEFELAYERQLQLLGAGGSINLATMVEDAYRICGQSYSISGGAGDFHGTGTTCSLEKPWTFSGSGVTVTFTPSSATGGTYAYSGAMSGIAVSGSGEYRVVLRDGVAVSIEAGGVGSAGGESA